jgi:uncharacterized protein YjiS (DUF1127 family)
MHQSANISHRQAAHVTTLSKRSRTIRPVEATKRNAWGTGVLCNDERRGTMFRTLLHYVRRWHKFDDAVLRLRALDDDLLADMGIDRTQISRRVRGKAPR